jgi:hypothetical protein
MSYNNAESLAITTAQVVTIRPPEPDEWVPLKLWDNSFGFIPAKGRTVFTVPLKDFTLDKDPPTMAFTGEVSMTPWDKGCKTVWLYFKLLVGPQTSLIKNATMFGGQVDEHYSFHFSATGGAPFTAWKVISGGVPGLSLSSTGYRSGVPTKAGNWPVGIEVLNRWYCWDGANYVVHIG